MLSQCPLCGCPHPGVTLIWALCCNPQCKLYDERRIYELDMDRVDHVFAWLNELPEL